MKKFRTLNLAITMLLALCVTMSCLQFAVYAASAYSNESTATVNGYSYTYYSSVHNDANSTWGYGSASSNSGNVPTGYIGINARLYNSSGTLVKSSSWTYSDRVLSGLSVPSGSYTTKGTYYAKSQVQFYNGNGYTTYTCNATPNITRVMAAVPQEEPYEVNDSGLTYGSNYFSESIDDNPDLIRVIGINGVEGYIYSEDISWEPNSLDEVLDHIGSGEAESYTVPVYEEDGITVVDTFEICAPDDIDIMD